MKNKVINISLVLIGMIFFASPCYAVQILTLVNHFNDALKTKVEINGHIVPDLPAEFVLNSGDRIKTRVLTGSEAYIGMDAVHQPGKNAYFGVDRDNFHGYIGQGIAYSWVGDQYMVVTFCTPEEYSKHNHC